jgi:hypothetical protein
MGLNSPDPAFRRFSPFYVNIPVTPDSVWDIV